MGRNTATVHPQGLDILAWYDYDQPLEGGGPAGYTNLYLVFLMTVDN